MKQDDIAKEFAFLADVRLSDADKQDILKNLRAESRWQQTRRQRRRRKSVSRFRWVTTSAAAVAIVAVGAGVYTATTGGLSRHGANTVAPVNSVEPPSNVSSNAVVPNPVQPPAKPVGTPITTVHFTDMQMLTTDTGWAWDYRTDFELAHTADGGKTWYKVTLPSSPPKNDFLNPYKMVTPYFLNDQIGWLTWIDSQTSKVTILHTTDGGATWTQSSLDASSNHVIAVSQIQFINEKTGWLLGGGEPGMSQTGKYLYFTQDGGVTWTQISTSQKAQPALPRIGMNPEMRFTDAANGWLVSESPVLPGKVQLYHTTDGGRTWEDDSSKVPTPSTNDSVNAIHAPVFSGQDGSMVVDFYEQSGKRLLSVYHTSDGGASWTRTDESGMDVMPQFGNDVPMWFTDGNTGWGFKNGVFQVSNDGGVHWNALPSDSIHKTLPNYMEGGVNVNFVNPKTGWMLFQGSGIPTTLLHTTDGGQTWEKQ